MDSVFRVSCASSLCLIRFSFLPVFMIWQLKLAELFMCGFLSLPNQAF